MILTILIFFILIGVLIVVHELGHFLTAKRAGMRVDEFGFGFPPRLFGVRRGETMYSLNAIPLGGFVKIYGEDGGERRNPRSFGSKSAGRRAFVLSAGVFMNLLLAAVILAIGMGTGIPTAVTPDNADRVRDVTVRITAIAPGSPADTSSLQIGDAITAVTIRGEHHAVGGEPDVLQTLIRKSQGESIVLTTQRGERAMDVSIAPRRDPPVGEGALGIAMLKTGIIAYPWYEAIGRAIVETGRLVVLFVVLLAGLLWELMTTGSVQADLAGPVGIAALTGQAAQLGMQFVLQLAVVLSINLAIINALPFPALDGGRLLFLAIEKIKGSPVSQRIEQAVHTVGFLFLIGLMILVTVHDIGRFL